MPELPEVETVCRGLRPHLEGNEVTRVIARRPDLRFPLPMDLFNHIEGLEVENINRRAKYIIISFKGSDDVLIWHLGMSGRVIIIEPQQDKYEYEKHEHVIFKFKDGAEVRYRDPRRFGFMKTAKKDDVENVLNAGVEPLSDDLTISHLKSILKGKNQGIKVALLDQRLVAGLGNIYVCEALFTAGINPWKSAGDITTKELDRLIPEIKVILQKAIEAGGSSLKDHAQVNGEMGYFQHSFNVYGKELNSCLLCKKGVILRKVQQGRATFFCPVCQEVEHENLFI